MAADASTSLLVLLPFRLTDEFKMRDFTLAMSFLFKTSSKVACLAAEMSMRSPRKRLGGRRKAALQVDTRSGSGQHRTCLQVERQWPRAQLCSKLRCATHRRLADNKGPAVKA